MSGACDPCLRRGYLIGRLAARIAAMLDRPGKRVGALLSLPEGDLVGAVLGAAGDAAHVLGDFHPCGRERT